MAEQPEVQRVAARRSGRVRTSIRRLLRPWPRRTRRIIARVLLTSAGVVTAMCLVLFIAMRLDDRRIESHLGTATATVLTVSPLHTGIEFVDGTGATVRPPNGVLYPGLLQVGQQFVVEYDTREPEVVRVAGRTASVGNLVVGATVLGSWIVAGSLAFWLRRPPARQRRARRPGGRDVAAGRAG